MSNQPTPEQKQTIRQYLKEIEDCVKEIRHTLNDTEYVKDCISDINGISALIQEIYEQEME